MQVPGPRIWVTTGVERESRMMIIVGWSKICTYHEGPLKAVGNPYRSRCNTVGIVVQNKGSRIQQAGGGWIGSM